MTGGLTLHHLEASRSIRIVWLLESLGVSYKLESYVRDSNSKLAENEPFSGKGLAAVHPTGRAPLLQDGDLVLAETGTIMRHLLEHYDAANLYPKPSEKTQAAIDQNFWIDFSEASVMLHLVPLNYLLKGKANTKDGSSIQEKAIARGIHNDMRFVEEALKKNGGTLSGSKDLGPADFANLFGVELFALLSSVQTQEWRDALNLNIGPETQKWIKRCHEDAKLKIACSKERGGKLTPDNYLHYFIGK